MRLGLFIPCFVDLSFPNVGIATVRLLEHLGFDLEFPPAQTCCGQPHFNAGHLQEARALALRFCEIFSPYDAIVSPSGSCVAMVRNHYPALVGEQDVCARTFELSEFLVRQRGFLDLGARLPGRAALHIGCHALRELRIDHDVRTLLSHVAGLELVDVSSQQWCCGFGGTFSVKFPEISTAMGDRKLQPILDADVDYLISTDSSCLLHLQGMLDRKKLSRPKPMHLAEVLATCVEAT